MKQKTIKEAVTFEGIGLHTGQPSVVTVKPAPPNFGRKILIANGEAPTIIPCDLRNVQSTHRSTDLGKKDTSVKTVEHLLSALYGCGVDNAEIHVEGPEIPILDGSAGQFSSEIRAAGVITEDQDAPVFRVIDNLRFVDEDSGSEYLVYPSEELRVQVILEYDDQAIGHQSADAVIGDMYMHEIAPARTYAFSREIIELADHGLIKGGDLGNAIVFKSDGVSNGKLKDALKKLGKTEIDSIIDHIDNGPHLKFDNEPARHKLLDLVGDLSLLGVRLQAGIVATKPGHTGNVAFARWLKELIQKEVKLKGKPRYNPNNPPVYGVEEIQGFLPHRYPFLLVDKIIELSETQVVGIKNVTFDEGFFQGHFPGNSVFPGVLQMEALAQTGGILALNSVPNPSDWDTYFLKMDNVRFKQKVVPGDTLILKMELLSPIRRGIVHMQGTAYVGDSIVSEGELTAQIVDRTTLKS